MDLSSTIDNRINTLIKNDNNANSTLKLLTQSTIGIIEKYLTEFFNQYAVDNQLTTSQANAMINSWDKQQLQSLLNDIDITDLSEDAQQRAKVLGVKAGMNCGAMINAMIGLGIVFMSDKQIDLIRTHENNVVKQQIQHIAKVNPKLKSIDNMIFSPIDNSTNANVQAIRDDLGIKNQAESVGRHFKTGKNIKDGKTIVNQDKTVDIWSDNLWNKSDVMANDVENMVNNHIRHGMSLEDLHNMLAQHDNQKQFKPNQSLADRISQSQFNARRIIRTETSRLVNQVNYTTYQASGVKKVGLHHEPSACDNCKALADQGPWDIDDAPSIPEDTHPNCYCYLTNEDDDSDDLTVNPNKFNK